VVPAGCAARREQGPQVELPLALVGASGLPAFSCDRADDLGASSGQLLDQQAPTELEVEAPGRVRPSGSW